MLSRHAKKVSGAMVLTGAVAVAVVKVVKVVRRGCNKKEEEHNHDIQRLKAEHEYFKEAMETTKDTMKEMLKDMKETKTALGALQKVVKSSVEDKDNDNGVKEAMETTKDMMKEMLKDKKETKTALDALQKVVKSSVEDKDNDNGEPGSYFRAISVQGMRDVLVKDAKDENLGDDADIYALLEPVLLKKGKELMCPRDDRPGTAYVDALFDSNHAGRANIMISYAWEYQLLLIVDTLTEWCDKMKWPHKSTFVWFCCVCINQHRVKERVDRGEVVSFKKFEQDFGRRVRGIRHILSLLSPWEGPTYITRSWCIYELFLAKETGAKYELLMPKSEEKSFQRTLWDSASGSNMKKCWQLLEKVRLQDAKATCKDDKQYIDSLVKAGSGFRHLNHTVRQLLKEWFVSSAENQLQVLQEVKTDVDCAHACSQVGFFLEQMGRTHFVRAIEFYRGGLGMLTEKGQHHTLQAVRFLTSIGSIKRRRGEEDDAFESLRFAQKVIDVLEPSDDVSDAKATLCDEMGLVSKVDNAIRRWNFEEAWKIRSEVGTLNTMDGAVLSSHYGRFEAEIGALKDAIPRFERGIEILDGIENGICTPLGASMLSSLANAKRKLNMPEEAMQDLKRCCDVLDKTESFTMVGAGVWSIRAETEFSLEKWDDALKSYGKAWEIRDEIRAMHSIDGVKMLIGMAKILLKKDEKAKACAYIHLADYILGRMGSGEKQRAYKEICGKFWKCEGEGRQCWEILDAVWPASLSRTSGVSTSVGSDSLPPLSGVASSLSEEERAHTGAPRGKLAPSYDQPLSLKTNKLALKKQNAVEQREVEICRLTAGSDEVYLLGEEEVEVMLCALEDVEVLPPEEEVVMASHIFSVTLAEAIAGDHKYKVALLVLPQFSQLHEDGLSWFVLHQQEGMTSWASFPGVLQDGSVVAVVPSFSRVVAVLKLTALALGALAIWAPTMVRKFNRQIKYAFNADGAMAYELSMEIDSQRTPLHPAAESPEGLRTLREPLVIGDRYTLSWSYDYEDQGTWRNEHLLSQTLVLDSPHRDSVLHIPRSARALHLHARFEGTSRQWSGIVCEFECLQPKAMREPNRQNHTYASHWCVTPDQLQQLLDNVEGVYPAPQDPNVYTVVDEIIKPAVRDYDACYALMVNPIGGGIPVKHFCSHAWGESFKYFCNQVLQWLRADPENRSGGLWICFLANPQTWLTSDLKDLLGNNASQSPFSIALAQADNFIIVRNPSTNIYSRLWCTFELHEGRRLNKPIVYLGSMPPSDDLRIGPGIGSRASCSVQSDSDMLRATMRNYSQQILDIWVEEAMRAPPA